MKYAIRFLLFCFVALATVQISSPPTWERQVSLKTLLSKQLNFQVDQAHAAPGTSLDKARALYYYVAGPSTAGYPAGYSGPTNGLIGLVDEVLNHPAMLEAFLDRRILSCSQIPSSGTLAARGHTEGDLTISFGTARKRIPATFASSANSLFEKRIDISTGNGTPLASVELSCEASGIQSGYLVVESDRRVEMYYQFNSNTGAKQVESYMDYPSALGNSINEKIVLRFQSDNNDQFRMWAVRTTDDAAQGSFGVAVEGDRASDKAEVRVVEDNDAVPDTATTLETGASSCISIVNGSTTTACPMVTAPTPLLDGGSFNLPGTDAADVGTLEYLVASQPSTDFGSVLVGATGTVSVTLTNVSGVSVTGMNGSGLAAPFSFAGGSYPGTGGTCGVSLAAASTCVLSLEFAPTTAGNFSDNLSLDYTANSLSYSTPIDVLGVSTAAAPPLAVLAISEADPYDFGSVTVGANATHIFTISNSGAGTATAIAETGLSAPFQFVGGAYPGTGGTCTTSLASAASCTIDVEFAPTVAGLAADSIAISYNDGAAAQTVNRSIMGTGTSPTVAVLTISETDPYDYGSIVTGGTSAFTFTVSNTGAATATAMTESGLATPFNFLGGVYPGTGGTCTTSLAAASSCTIVVEFAPVVVGVSSDSIQIDYNDGAAAQSVSRAVQGTGITPALLTISETDPYDFGSVSTAGSANHSFTITNSGGGTATAIFESGLAAPFGFSGGAFPGTSGTCGPTLAAGASCTIDVEFAPTVIGLANDTIDIGYNDGVSAQSSTRAVQGTGI